MKIINNEIAVKPFVITKKEKDKTPKPVSFGVLEPHELLSSECFLDTELQSQKVIKKGTTVYFRYTVLAHNFSKELFLHNGEPFILIPTSFIVAVSE